MRMIVYYSYSTLSLSRANLLSFPKLIRKTDKLLKAERRREREDTLLHYGFWIVRGLKN